MEGYGSSSYGDAFADVYDDWYGDLSPVDAVVDFLATRVDGLVVEYGCGTGRLSNAIASAGLPVIGLDASLAMIEKAAEHPGSPPAVVADMVEPPIRSACAGAVLIAFNTLFNVATSAQQRRALDRARSILRPNGIIVVEAFVPGDATTERSDHIDLVHLTKDSIVLLVSRTDPDANTVSGHHVELTDGEPVRLRPWHLHFHDIDSVDRLATSAGLSLDERYGGWSEQPFDSNSTHHVSVFGVHGGHR